MRSSFDQHFTINAINIHTVEGASCVNIGNNFPTGFQSYKKHTQGFGAISGDNNKIDGLKSLVNDGSLIDSFSGSTLEDNKWIKELMASKMQEVLDAEDIFEIDNLDDTEDEEEREEAVENDDSDAFNDVDDMDHLFENVFDERGD